MAIEAKRGCGYRKVGGTYMMGGEFLASCDRLPFKLDVCPCCGEGYRPSRGLRGIDPQKMLGIHVPSTVEVKVDPISSLTEQEKKDRVFPNISIYAEACSCPPACVMCDPPSNFQNGGVVGHYLEWIGGNFYKTPNEFTHEAQQLGISRRLKGGIPRNLVIGKTVVYCAHREILFTKRLQVGQFSRGIYDKGSGIFMAFTVNRLEHICTETEFNAFRACVDVENFDPNNPITEEKAVPIKRIEKLIRLQKQGVKLVPVPDNDKDHR